MDRRFIRRCCLLFFFRNSSDATIKWAVGSSDGALVYTQCTNSSDHCTDASYLGTVGSSDGVLSFLFLFFLVFWPLKNRLSSQFGMWYFGILGTYKCLQRDAKQYVSPIDHVTMNHQNQTRTNGIWGHVRYTNGRLWRSQFFSSLPFLLLEFFIFILLWFSKNKWSKQKFWEIYIWCRAPQRQEFLPSCPTTLGVVPTVGCPARWGQIPTAVGHVGRNPSAVGHGVRSPSVVPHGGRVTPI
jgi:hypothetical protein